MSLLRILPEGGDVVDDIADCRMPLTRSSVPSTTRACSSCTVSANRKCRTHVKYDNIMETLEHFFKQKLVMAESVGLPRRDVLLNPGIDFAKQCGEANLTIYRELEEAGIASAAHSAAGVTQDSHRKCWVSGTGTQCRNRGLHRRRMRRGAQIFRVHNVKAAVQAVKVLSAVSCHGALRLWSRRGCSSSAMI